MKAFSARSRTDVDAVVSPVGSSDLAHEHRADVLDVDPALTEGCQSLQIVIAGNLERVVQIRMLLHRHALRRKRGNDLFPGSVLRADPDGGRTFGLEGGADFLHVPEAELVDPAFQNPLRHRIADRQIFQRIVLRLRIAHLIHPAGSGAENAVYKALQIVKAVLLGDPDGFIYNSPVRNAVHEFELVYAHPENVADHRLHIVDRNL